MTTTDTVTQEAPIDLDSLPPQIEALRAHAKERRGKGWLRSADNLEASAYLIETLAAELARHRTQTPAQSGPVPWDDDEAFRQMHLLYNYADDDSRQFTRWQMSTAMYHAYKTAITQAEGPQA